MYEFKMPTLGAEMEYGTLLEWKVKPGDKVKKQDVIAIVDTDKAAIDVECWESGTVEEIIVKPGEKVPVGTVLALLSEESDFAETVKSAPPPEPLRIRMTPRARALAQKYNLDIKNIPGTGSQGEITETDIENSLPQLQESVGQLSSMQKVIANMMAKAKREIPHYYLSYEVDMSAALKWLEQKNKELPMEERIIYSVMLIKALALAAKAHPEFNGFYVNNDFKPAFDINIGIVISLRQGGLLAPALRQADKMSLSELMKALTDLVTRARSGSLRSSEVSDPTITMTNLGENGVDSVFGVIYPPQVSILGFGKINSRKTITVTLAADHRVSDGHRGSRFLTTLGRYLQNPEQL